MEYPAACCRNCGVAVLPLSQAQVTFQKEHMYHITTGRPSVYADRVRVEPHHNAGLHGHGKQQVRKISKVYCLVCDNNLGNVQQVVQTNGRFHCPLWYLKTRGVGYRRCGADDASVVYILPPALTFSKFVEREGIANAIGELPNKLSAEHCAHYKPEGVFALEGALAVASEEEIDAVLEKFENARLTPPTPPTPREHRKAVQNVTRAFVPGRPPRRQPPQVDDRWAWGHEQRANRQADKLETLARRGDQLLL
tara:strand:+ start:534 stop:1289 length:756 start_codon:yes stop_codon:yes gene_type:complete